MKRGERLVVDVNGDLIARKRTCAVRQAHAAKPRTSVERMALSLPLVDNGCYGVSRFSGRPRAGCKCRRAAAAAVARIEPAPARSIFYVKNTAPQPVTAFLIELVNYPGSWFTMLEDEFGAESIGAGAEKKIPVTNMTVERRRIMSSSKPLSSPTEVPRAFPRKSRKSWIAGAPF